MRRSSPTVRCGTRSGGPGARCDLRHRPRRRLFRLRHDAQDGLLPASCGRDLVDVHAISIEGPAFDLLTTMSKFLCLGSRLATVIKLATANAAAAIKRPDLGTLKVGSVGEATVMIVQGSGTFDYADSIGERLVGDSRLLSVGVVLAGRWWHPL